LERGEELEVLAGRIDLIVNATSVGLERTVKENPLPADIVTARHFVIDLVYGQETTALLDYARSRGAAVLDGTEMLLQQAAISYELWTGQSAPLSVMRAQLTK
jgi:shikimate dehydrogenase